MSETFNTVRNQLLLGVLLYGLMTNSHAALSILIEEAGKPKEIAALAVFLASDDSNYIHGSNVFMDDGWVLGR